MVYLIKYKTTKNEAPFYVLTVDQLAKKLGIETVSYTHLNVWPVRYLTT